MNLIFYITFALLLTEYSGSTYSTLLNFITLGLLGTYFLLKFNTIRYVLSNYRSKLFILSSLFLLIIVISMFRTNNREINVLINTFRVVKLVLFCLNSFAYFYSHYSVSKYENDLHETRTLNLIKVPTVFVLINLFLYIFLPIDILGNMSKATNVGESVLLSYLFGVNVDRVNFPLVTGINSFGSFVGATTIMALIGSFAFKYSRNRLFSIGICMLCIACLALIDTRSAIVINFLIFFLLIVVFKNKNISLLKYTVIVGSILPIIVFLNMDIFNENIFLEGFSRGDGDFKTGNNRLFIWVSCITEIIDFKFEHILGYGEYGQTGSGVSNSWSNIFETYSNSSLITTHNLILQLFFDTGYVGIFVFVSLFFNIFNIVNVHYKASGDSRLLIPISFFCFFILVGGTEAPQTHYATLHLLFFVLVYINYFDFREKWLRKQLFIKHHSAARKTPHLVNAK